MRTVQIDVYYPIPDGWGMCNSCELIMSHAKIGQVPAERGFDEYPPEILEEFQHISATIFSMAEKFEGQVLIKVWDPRSLQGLIKSIRFNVHHYPTFIVNGQLKLVGWDEAKLERAVRSALESQISAI